VPPGQFLSPVFRLSNRETSFEVLKQQIIDSEDKEKEKSEARLSKLKKPKHFHFFESRSAFQPQRRLRFSPNTKFVPIDNRH
jgi:hypothetical protein